jgi:hypothetical protein
MGKGYGQLIRADCFNTLERNSIPLFRTVQAHAVMSSFTCGQPTTSTVTGCNGNAFFPLLTDRQFIPVQYVLGNSMLYATFYGKNTDAVNLTDIEGKPVYMTRATANTLLPRELCPALYNRTKAQGPSIKNAHAFMPMVRKFNYDNEYIDRLNYDWVNSIKQLPEAPFNKTLCGEGCKIDDWLAFKHPATSLWTTIPEPFRITTHFEQSGSTVPNNPIHYANDYYPFCTNIPIKKADGTSYGNYTGYCTVMIFGECQHVFPVKPYLPIDPYETDYNNPKPIIPQAAMYSLEVLWFWVSDNPLLGSPLLSKIRYYLYSKAPAQVPNWTSPFQVMFSQSGIPTNYNFDVNLNVLREPCTDKITLNLSNLKILVTY